MLFTIIFENEAGIYSVECFGVDAYNAKVKEMQAGGLTILDVVVEEV